MTTIKSILTLDLNQWWENVSEVRISTS